MHIRISLALAALVGAACGTADEATETRADRSGAEDGEMPAASFYLGIDRATTPESAIPQILEAGRPELAAACADHPDALVRVFNPFDPGAFADVPCASMLSSAETSAAPTSEDSGEPIATARQPWSPIGLGCSIFMFGAGMVATSALCPRARDPRDAQRCSNYSGGALGALGLLCSLI
ncbi:hypothetical protein WMF38_19490 [Sorangium sp. So ce118]